MGGDLINKQIIYWW